MFSFSGARPFWGYKKCGACDRGSPAPFKAATDRKYGSKYEMILKQSMSIRIPQYLAYRQG